MLRNGAYNIVSAVARLGLGIISIPLLITIIGLETYGLWVLVSTVIGLLALAEAGLSVATTVFVARDLAEADQYALSQTIAITFGGMLAISTLIAIVLWFSALFLPLFPGLDASQQLVVTTALQLGSILVWSRLLQQVLIGVEQAYNRYGVLNGLLTVQAVLTSPGTVLVAFYGGRVSEMMLWHALSSCLMLVAHGVFVWRRQAVVMRWAV
jgi:O-antigen/teichoic acid export membrane protein